MSSEDQDSFPNRTRQWLIQKTQQLEPRPKMKIPLTTKPTKKAHSISFNEYSQLESQILRESDKLEQQILNEQSTQATNSNNSNKDELYEYNPHIVYGETSHSCVLGQQEKAELGLSDEGFCQRVWVGGLRIVIVGRINYEVIDGLSVGVYLPRKVYQFLNAKDNSKLELPERIIIIGKNSYCLIIRRQSLKDSKVSILSQPCLTIDPSIVLYPTFLCSWIACKRRITLTNYISSPNKQSKSMVYGTTCHRMLEWLCDKVVSAKDYMENREAVVRKLFMSNLYEFYLVGSTFEEFLEFCGQGLNNILSFYKGCIMEKQEIEVDKYSKLGLIVDRVVGSERMLQSKFFGMKGKVDLLLAGRLIDHANKTEKEVLIPCELKTGKKASDSHKRQVDIYNILVREQYKQDTIGMLFYSETNQKLFRLENQLSTFENILVIRNQIVLNIIKLYSNAKAPDKLILPKFDLNQCNFCEIRTICESIYESQVKIKDIQQLPSHAFPEYKPDIEKISKSERRYISRWINLTHLEELQNRQDKKNCIGIGIQNFVVNVGNFKSAINGKFENQETASKKVELLLEHRCRKVEDLDLFENYYKNSQSVRVRIFVLNFVHTCKIKRLEKMHRTVQLSIQLNNADVCFDLSKVSYFRDEDDFDAEVEVFENMFYAQMRHVLYRLVEGDSTWLKRLIIDEEIYKPEVEQDSDDDDVLDIINKYKKQKKQLEEETELNNLNEDQKKAFNKAVQCDRFCLIEGLPGTGKTELIVRLISKFTKQHKKILITTFTNRSLDNILERLARSKLVNPDIIIREGSLFSFTEQMKQFTSRDVDFKSIDDYSNYFDSKKIWFITLSSLAKNMNVKEMFDVVIVDEASQCLEPTCVEALLKAHKFVLIGDYRQLQPVIRSQIALDRGMGLSLFERLCLQFPQNSVALNKQYRMNESIMKLSNQLVYEGELELASKQTKDQILKLPSNWLNLIPKSFIEVMDPHEPIRFMNYDAVMSKIAQKMPDKQDSCRKAIEIELTSYIYRTLTSIFKIEKDKIAIISAYNATVYHLGQFIKKSDSSFINKGNILTIDKSQGIDKEIIILLVEKSRSEDDLLIENPRRLNVALTRAKSKLFVIASESHLQKMKVWKGDLAKLLKEEKVDLSKAMIRDMIQSFN